MNDNIQNNLGGNVIPFNPVNNAIKIKGIVLKNAQLSGMKTEPKAKGSFSINAYDIKLLYDFNDRIISDEDVCKMINLDPSCHEQFQAGFKSAHKLIESQIKFGIWNWLTCKYQRLLDPKIITFEPVGELFKLRQQVKDNTTINTPLVIPVSGKLTDKQLVSRFVGAMALIYMAKNEKLISEQTFTDYLNKTVIYKEESAWSKLKNFPCFWACVGLMFLSGSSTLAFYVYIVLKIIISQV